MGLFSTHQFAHNQLLYSNSREEKGWQGGEVIRNLGLFVNEDPVEIHIERYSPPASIF